MLFYYNIVYFNTFLVIKSFKFIIYISFKLININKVAIVLKSFLLL